MQILDAADDAMPGMGLYYQDQGQTEEIDSFSASQPVTPRTDHDLATTPKINVRLGLSMSPNIMSKVSVSKV
jgi:hypothetical protein